MLMQTVLRIHFLVGIAECPSFLLATDWSLLPTATGYPQLPDV